MEENMKCKMGFRRNLYRARNVEASRTFMQTHD